MNSKLAARIIAIVLAALMLMSVIYGAITAIASPPPAGAITQKEIEELKNKKKALEQEKSQVSSSINEEKYNLASATAKKEVLDDRIRLTQLEIDNIAEQLVLYGALVTEQKETVELAKNDEDAQWALYKRRIRDLEENGRITYIGVLFSANSFSDLLARIDFIDDIMKSDEQVYQDLVKARERHQEKQAELEELVAEMEVEEAELAAKQEELEREVTEALEVISEIEVDLAQSLAAYEELVADSKKMQDSINAAVDQYNKEQAAKNNGSTVVGTGVFMWPSRDSNYVTSLFGTRLHPTFKDYRMHTGVDIGGGINGKNIVAADSGTVILATYNSSYGNYVVINHGNGYTTLYAHMQKMKVKKCDKVTKGDVIGLVGSTGNSTGPHIHFEISYNGTRKDPLSFFKAGTYRLAPGLK